MVSFYPRTLFPISRAVLRKMQQWSIKCTRGEFWGAMKHKPQQCSQNDRVCLLGLNLIRRLSVLLRKLNEIGCSLHFNAQTNAHPRQPNPIQLQFGIQPSCAMKKYRFKQNSPRPTPPREHSNATTKAYAYPRDWSVQVGDTNRIWCKANSTASRNSQRCGV